MLTSTAQRIVISLACLAVAGVFAGPAAAPADGADWPIYRGPDHNGISTEAGWLASGGTLKVAWTRQVGTGCSSVTVVGRRLYAMGNATGKDTVFCFDAVTGKEQWTYSYAAPLDPKLYEGGPSATPTVAGGKVYTLSKRGLVFCFDAESGKKVWGVQLKATPPRWGFAGSPLVLGERVILNAGRAGTALDAATGKVLWDSGTGPGGYSTPVPYTVGGKTLLALFSAASVLAVNAADGKGVWEHPWKTRYLVNSADPIVTDGGKKVFVSSGYNYGCALLDVSGATPKELWRNRNMRNHHTCSVAHNGVVYGFDESDLRCMDLATGRKKWSQGGLGKGTLMLADGKLIILAERGKLVVADASPTGFKEVTSVQAVTGKCWSVPVLANGRIYAKSKKGALACIVPAE